MVMEGESALGSEHTMPDADGVLQNWTLETCVELLTYVAPINLT